MALSNEYGGTSGALRVSSTARLTVPAGLQIYYVVPQATCVAKLTPRDGYAWVSADRTATGAAVSIYQAITGAYSAIAVTSGACDVYLKPLGAL